MTENTFPHPHQDESADDPYTGPIDEFEDEQLGASPMESATASRAPKKRLALFAIAGAIALLALVIIIGSLGEDEDPLQTAQIDEVARGENSQSTAAEPILSTQPILPQTGPPSSAGTSISTPSTSVNPASGPAFIDPSEFQNPTTVGPTTRPTTSAPTGLTGPMMPADVPDTDIGIGLPSSTPSQTPTSPSSAFQPLSDEELERQARLDLGREAEQRRQAITEARLEANRAEEDRLRSAGTLLTENANLLAVGGRAAAPGTSRFIDPGNEIAPGQDPLSDALSATGQDYGILPGTRVGAELVSEFIGDLEGGGLVEARLTEALHSPNGVVLPAGSRAFGQASGRTPQPGQPARVSIDFTVFVTPQGQIVRNLRGSASDPETLATSIPARVDNRYLDRIFRGVASTAVDLLLTQGAQQRRSVFEENSPRDQAINDARYRAAALIGAPIGTERSVPSAVVLDAGTPLVIMFGL